MRITQFCAGGNAAAWQKVGPEFTFDSLSPNLNLFCGPARSGKSSAANLVGHLLYGRLARRDIGEQPLEGSVSVETRGNSFELRRNHDGTPQGRLTIGANDGTPVDSRTMQTLLGGISPQLLAQLYAVDFSEPTRVETLFTGPIAAAFTAGGGAELTSDREVVSEEVTCGDDDAHHRDPHRRDVQLAASVVHRGRIDDLVRQRDELARQIEVQMANQRTDSALLERELQEVDASLADRRRRAERLEGWLAEIDGRVAELESRLRYFSLESTVRYTGNGDGEAQRAELEELDAEIGRCRQMLSDQQSREAKVRRDLAGLHPDGAADGLASLADQRATLTVLERLLDDLDAEISLLARSHEPARCVARESHGRITPVAEMLRQQVYAMCGQLTEQQRAARRQQLHVEARQLSRAQTDLSEQLEHLLWRRQLLSHEAQLATQPAVTLPQPPIDSYCKCESHQQFVQHSDAMLLGRVERGRYQDEADQQRTELSRQRCEIADELDSLQREIAAAQARWEQLQQQRGRLVGKTSLDELRGELARLEDEIQRSVQVSADRYSETQFAELRLPLNGPAQPRSGWRASDVLAQLTDGRLTQIRINRGGESATVADRSGAIRPIARLTPAERDQVYLALTLALVSSQAQRGNHLPLVLDEPFLRQDAVGAAAMAGVLHEFAARGRQTLVFTEDRHACRRFEALGIGLRHMRQPCLAEPITPQASSPKPIVQEPITSERITPASIPQRPRQ